jgi:hypothetical protein
MNKKMKIFFGHFCAAFVQSDPASVDLPRFQISLLAQNQSSKINELEVSVSLYFLQ